MATRRRHFDPGFPQSLYSSVRRPLGIELHLGAAFLDRTLPTLGHAFSVFLRFRGGRGIDTWFGVWTALTLYEIPLVMSAAAIVGSLLLIKGEVRTLVIPLVLVPYLVLRQGDLWMVWLALAQLTILSAKIVVFYLSPNRHRQAVRS